MGEEKRAKLQRDVGILYRMRKEDKIYRCRRAFLFFSYGRNEGYRNRKAFFIPSSLGYFWGEGKGREGLRSLHRRAGDCKLLKILDMHERYKLFHVNYQEIIVRWYDSKVGGLKRKVCSWNNNGHPPICTATQKRRFSGYNYS